MLDDLMEMNYYAVSSANRLFILNPATDVSHSYDVLLFCKRKNRVHSSFYAKVIKKLGPPPQLFVGGLEERRIIEGKIYCV
jgi:hypothetical protein